MDQPPSETFSKSGNLDEKPSDKISKGTPKFPPGFGNEVGGGGGGGGWKFLSGRGGSLGSTDASLFSSSLPVLPHAKLNVFGMDKGEKSFNDLTDELLRGTQEAVSDDSVNGTGGNQPIGNTLPDEADFLSGLMDDLVLGNPHRHLDDMEDDLFGSGGGMEIDTHESLRMGVARVSISDGLVGNGIAPYPIANGVGAVAGEHPYGEHPSRTLFVRNINSNVEDSELRDLFEKYGDIRALYTACKHRGFVMISYYDIRAARTAMKVLQNKPLRRRKLDIHFSIPKDNPSDKDMNQGTLVANLDPSVSNDDLLLIFGEYGEVKEIRETPHKRHHKFIEFYDVRAAEAALKALNRSDIAGTRIKLEPSRPGGTRRNLMSSMNQDPDQDETLTFRNHVGSPITNSPPGNWLQYYSPIEHSPLHAYSSSPNFGIASPAISNSLPGQASFLHSQLSNSAKISPIGKDQRRGGGIMEEMFGGPLMNQTSFQQSHFVPEQGLNQLPGTSSFGTSTSNGSGIGTLSGPQFLWGSPNPHSELSSSPAKPKLSAGNPFASNKQGLGNGFPITVRAGSYLSSTLPRHHHLLHVGSAPPGIPLERQFGFAKESPQFGFSKEASQFGFPKEAPHFNYQKEAPQFGFSKESPQFGFPKESPETSFMRSTYGGLGIGSADRSYMMNMGSHALSSSYLPDNGSPSLRMMSSPRVNHMFLNDGLYPGGGTNNIDNFVERGRNCRGETNNNQVDSKKQFQLDLDKIINGEDTRTTLMIKNIPNKYTSKMLLAAIDEQNKGTYDFLYLPIDFKNKCNVGYAFINMLSPKHIMSFYQAFNGKKWEKFNSEKVASLAYARIQGKTALVTHFQNSSLMNEDKRCRPIVFHPEGPDGGDQMIQEHLPSGSFNSQSSQPTGSLTSGDSTSFAAGFSSSSSTSRS